MRSCNLVFVPSVAPSSTKAFIFAPSFPLILCTCQKYFPLWRIYKEKCRKRLAKKYERRVQKNIREEMKWMQRVWPSLLHRVEQQGLLENQVNWNTERIIEMQLLFGADRNIIHIWWCVSWVWTPALIWKRRLQGVPKKVSFRTFWNRVLIDHPIWIAFVIAPLL